jgi:glycine oxidase
LDVAVIGGGVIGLGIAWRAALSGLAVLLADPAPGTGASHVAAGMLAPVGEAHFGEQRLLALNLESWRRYPSFCAELEEASGLAVGFRASGTLMVARDADDNAALEREYAFRESMNLDVRRLSSRECRDLEPRLSPSVRGGIFAAGDMQVDPRALVASLLVACERAGVHTVRETAALRVEHGQVTGVLCGTREFAVPSVVLAAGCWSPRVDGLPAGVIPPVRAVKGQIIRLRAQGGEPFLTRVVRGVDVYILSRTDGTVVIGSTVEERGFDTTVTAGAVYDLLRDARELVPDVAELQLVEVNAGLRPGTPDNAPLIGETGVPGLLVATGHYRNGVLLMPATAEAIAGILTGAPASEAVASFSPRRFQPLVSAPA